MAKRLAILVCALMVAVVGYVSIGPAQPTNPGKNVVEGRAIWAHYPYPGNTEESVRDFVDHCAKAHINIVVMCMKGGDGTLFYPSKKFPDAVHKDCKKFDILKSLVRNCHSKSIKVHAWVCDFTENPDSPVVKQHPEWAALNANGKMTNSEVLGGDYGPYDTIWMCPARRPGYVDNYIFPLIEELLVNYDIDGLHHDYVRYPGDVAPDGYCFCDWCLDEFMRYNHFYYECKPDTSFNPEPAITTPTSWIANWWLDYTVRPKEWNKMTRKEKADFILKGSSMKNGPADLDYFFYEFRSDMITKYVREFWEFANKVKPGIEISSAVFKNPPLSGRNIGQRWTDFAAWHDIMMPMVYRSHFPGDFETYLDLAAEYARYENKWCEGLCHVYYGMAIYYLYNEEQMPLNEMDKNITALLKNLSDKYEERRSEIISAYKKIKDHLRKCSAQLADEFDKNLPPLLKEANAKEIKERLTSLKESIDKFRKEPPEGYYPPEKFVRTIEAIRKGGAKGIVIYYSGAAYNYKLWQTIEKCFWEPSDEPYLVAPMGGVSIQNIRRLESKLKEKK